VDGDHSVRDRPVSVHDAGWSVAIAPALVVLLLGGFPIFVTDAEPQRRAREEISRSEAPGATADGPSEGAWVTAVEARALSGAPIAAAVEERPKDIAHPSDRHDPWMHPHPITPEHQRIQAENETVQKLNDAVSMRDVRGIRELIVAYRGLDPNDTDRAQLGYGVIADCLERRDEASLARARDFYAGQRHSPLRRFVRRICFENRN
jgi:hypothetical protein